METYEIIDFTKYLKCDGCRKVGLYCEPHREEVEGILAKLKEDRKPRS